MLGNHKYFLIIFLHLALLLQSCAGNKGDDLDKFMEEAGKSMKAEVEPLPEVKPYVPIQFNADRLLNDPFKPRKAAATQSALQPNLNRQKEPLEAYPLESLKYVGSIFKDKFKFALIKTPDASVQQVKIGNFMGQNFGVLIDIKDEELLLKEIVQDELSAEWVERSVSIILQEPK